MQPSWRHNGLPQREGIWGTGCWAHQVSSCVAPAPTFTESLSILNSPPPEFLREPPYSSHFTFSPGQFSGGCGRFGGGWSPAHIFQNLFRPSLPRRGSGFQRRIRPSLYLEVPLVWVHRESMIAYGLVSDGVPLDSPEPDEGLVRKRVTKGMATPCHYIFKAPPTSKRCPGASSP